MNAFYRRCRVLRDAYIVGLVLLGITAAAAQTPLRAEFKGVPLGASEQVWVSTFPFFRCEDSADRTFSDRDCVLVRPGDDLRAEIQRACGQTQIQVGTDCWNDVQHRYDEFLSFGGTQIEYAVARFVADRLSDVSIIYLPRDFQKLTSALTVKYGALKITEETLTNLMGAKVSNTVARWTVSGGGLENRKYTNTLERSSFDMMSPPFAANFLRRSQEAAKGNAKSL
jgi:hypothetical protein